MVSLPRPGAATYMDDVGFEGDLVIDAISDAVEGLYDSLIINGNMDHFERVVGSGTQTSPTTFNVVTSFAADRMFVLPAGASVTQARSTTVPPAGSQYSLAVTGAASVTTVDIGQRIRQAIVAERGLQSLVFSCYVRNESGAAYTPTLRIGTPAAADDFTTVTNRLSQALQSCANAAWTRVFWVFDPTAYTNIANGMEVVLRIPSGSSVAGMTSRIAQFDVRPGGSLVPYIPADPEFMLYLCRRYARVYGGLDANQVLASGGQAIGTTTGRADLLFNPRMRGAPTITISTAADFAMSNSAGTLTALTALTFAAVNPESAICLLTVASGMTAGDASRVFTNATLNARLYAIAELT